MPDPQSAGLPRDNSPTVPGLIRKHDWSATSLGDPLTWPSRLQHLVEFALGNKDPVFLVCAQDRILLYNDAFAELCGHRHPAAFGRRVDQALPELWDIIGAQHGKVFDGETVHLSEVAWPVGEGQDRRVHDVILSPARNGLLPVAWVLGQVMPVEQAGNPEATEHEGRPPTAEALEALRASEERLGMALRVGRIATWDWNIETGKITWSDEHFRMEGYEPGEVEPSYEVWTARIHPDDRPGTEAALLAAKDQHRLYEHEFRFLLPGGRIVWSAALGQFFYDESGEPVRMVGVMRDVTDHRHALETQQVLIAELQHRTRNLIGVVRSLSRKTMERSHSLDDFYERFGQRLSALARVQGLLSQLEHGDRVTFDDLIRAELGAHGVMEDSDQVALEGPPGVRLRSSTVQTLALALHELATNASKYGALRDGGHLRVRWQLQPGANENEPMLDVDWHETGVSMPEPGQLAARNGYGRELIERALPYQLNAQTSFAMNPDGVRCTITLPVSHANLAAD